MTLDLAACPYFNDVHTERLDGFGSYYASYYVEIPATHPSAEFANEKDYIRFGDLDGNAKEFVIRTTANDGKRIKITSEDSAVDELMCAPIHFAAPAVDFSAEDLLTDVLAGTRWQVGIVEAGAVATADADWRDYPMAWACVLEISELFSLEIRTRVIVEDCEVTARYIDLLQSRGTYTGKVLRYGGNTKQMVRYGDGGEVYSAIIGLGKADASGDPLTFSDVVWEVSGGDPVDKPTAQNWVGTDAARIGAPADPDTNTPEVVGYGIPLGDGTFAHRFGIFRDPEETDAGHLLDKSYAYWLKHNKPQYRYDVDAIALDRMPPQQPGDPDRSQERMRLGDTVGVVNMKVAVPYEDAQRVTEVRYCYSDMRKDAVVLGDPLLDVADHIAATIRLGRKVAGMDGIWTGA